MSRIGKKPIPLPANVKYTMQGNTVLVEGPKGKISPPWCRPASRSRKKDGVLLAVREKESLAALHGLTRSLVSNAVEGVTKGWTKELDIVGIGYRAELKGKGMVVFTLGFSHAIEFPLPTGIDVTIDPKQTRISDQRHRSPEGRPGGSGYALTAQAGSLQKQGCSLRRRTLEEESRQDRRQVKKGMGFSP